MITTFELFGILLIIAIRAFVWVVTVSSAVLAVKIQRLIEMMIRSGGFFCSLLRTTLFHVMHSGYGTVGGPKYMRSFRSRNGQSILRYGMSFQPWALATALTPGNKAEACESPTKATVYVPLGLP